MRNASVNARIPEDLKESGNEVLKRYGLSQSQGIYEFYRFMDENKRLPFETSNRRSHSEKDWSEAFALVDSLVRNNRFSKMTEGEIKAERAVSRGILPDEGGVDL